MNQDAPVPELSPDFLDLPWINPASREKREARHVRGKLAFSFPGIENRKGGKGAGRNCVWTSDHYPQYIYSAHTIYCGGLKISTTYCIVGGTIFIHTGHAS
jgi:hypothetical protein